MKSKTLVMPMLALMMNAAFAQEMQPTQANNVTSGPEQPAPQQPQAATSTGQWIQVNGPGVPGGFPAPPGQGNPGVPQQMQGAFPQSNYGAGNYAVAGQQPGQAQAPYPQQNGVAPLPPLQAPQDASDFNEAMKVVAPYAPSQIREMRGSLEETRKAKAYQPVRAIPQISSVSVDLSPGASIPVLRVMPGEISNLVVLDSTGAPWPLVAPPKISKPDLFTAEWLKDSHIVVVSTISPYESGNLSVFLQGSATPVVVKLVTGEPDGKNEKTRVVDARLDMRVPGRGPNAKAALMGPGKIALYDDTLQAFLDGIPPKDARAVETHGDVPSHTKIWQYNGDIFVRTQQDIQTAFDQSLASGDGTKVYRLPATPYVTLSQMGQSVTLQLDIN